MTELDLSILKYYKEGGELSGFEPAKDWKYLYQEAYLDGDLELSKKGWAFIKSYPDWDKVVPYKNKTVVVVKPTL